MEKHSKEVIQWVYEVALSDPQIVFKSLYSAYFQRLVRLTSLYVPSFAETEEIVSDTLLSLWNNRKSLLEISNSGSYIYGTARHKAINLYRAQHIEKVQIGGNTVNLFTHTDTTPEEELISKECTDYLSEMINTLPDKCKMVSKLIHEDKMKYKDVVNILEISIKTLGAHIATAVRKLREFLAKEIND